MYLAAWSISRWIALVCSCLSWIPKAPIPENRCGGYPLSDDTQRGAWYNCVTYKHSSAQLQAKYVPSYLCLNRGYDQQTIPKHTQLLMFYFSLQNNYGHYSATDAFNLISFRIWKVIITWSFDGERTKRQLPSLFCNPCFLNFVAMLWFNAALYNKKTQKRGNEKRRPTPYEGYNLNRSTALITQIIITSFVNKIVP